MTDDKKRLAALRKRVKAARNFPDNTCPASRHLHTMADALLKHGSYSMLAEEPEHCAESMLAVLASLWEARTVALQMRKVDGTDTFIQAKAV